ncbi:unnamed protein product, partial [Mesorhabditis spiculigera]
MVTARDRKRQPIHTAGFLNRLRAVGEFVLTRVRLRMLPRIISAIRCRPDIVVTAAQMRLGWEARIDLGFRWAKSASMWKYFVFRTAKLPLKYLLGHLDVMLPDRLLTCSAPPLTDEVDPGNETVSWLLDLGLERWGDAEDCQRLRASFEYFFAKKHGPETESWFFRCPYPHHEVKVMARLHAPKENVHFPRRWLTVSFLKISHPKALG